jgi:hypothetical protein
MRVARRAISAHALAVFETQIAGYLLARVSTWSLLCAGTFVVGAKLGVAVPSDLSVVSESQSRPLTVVTAAQRLGADARSAFLH